MTAIDRLRERLLDRIPFAEDVSPTDELRADDPPITVTISALGGRPSVQVDARAFERLVAQGGGVAGSDLTPSDLGRLLTTARLNGPRALLDALLAVRSASPLYRITNPQGRSWRPTPPTRLEPTT